MIKWIQKNQIAAYIIGCLLPVHAILWPMLLLGVEQDSLKPFKILFALLPTSIAFMIVWIGEGEKGVSQLWRKLINRKNPWKVYLLAFMSFILLAGVALFARYFYDGYLPNLDDLPSPLTILIASPFLLLFPGFTEEFGWRGFLQDRLRLPNTLSSAVVGIVWGAWHTMDFLMGNWPASYFFVTIFFLYIIGVSVVIGAIYHFSGGSVFIAMLAHFSANVVNFFIPIWQQEAGLITASIYVGATWVVVIILLIYELKVRYKRKLVHH